MYRVLNCLAYEHNWVQLTIALSLCFISTSVAAILLQRSRQTMGVARIVWMATSGAAGGFGIWATHFVAMLAYDPGVVVAYRASPTFTSLFVAVVSIWAAVASAVWLDRRFSHLVSGILFGIGVSLMHFMGMTAIDFPGMLEWDMGMAFSAIILAVVLATAAFYFLGNLSLGLKQAAVGTAMLSLAILAMHFTAMGAVTVVPGLETLGEGARLSPAVMSTVVTVIAFSLLFTGGSAALFAIRAERFERKGEETFRLVVNGISGYAIFMLDLEGRVSHWNSGAERAKGYTEEEIIGAHISCFYTPEDQEAGVPDRILTQALDEGRVETEGWRVRKDGSRFWAHVIIQAVFVDDRIIGLAKITRDCTSQMLAAAKLKKASGDLDLALSHMANGLALFSPDGRLVLHNKRLVQIVGVEPSIELRGRTLREICERNGVGMNERYRRYQSLMDSRKPGETTTELENGKILRITHSPIEDGSCVMTIEDVTERVRSEERISHMARHDVLTGLPNRRHFVEVLEKTIENADRQGRKVAVIGIDLDRFKEINDTYGHGVGDEVLCVLSQRMEEGLREGELVGRAGGDEFTAFKIYSADHEIHEFVSRLTQALTQKIALKTGDLVPGGSLGIAVYPHDAMDSERLLANADMAMYRAKESIDEMACFYESSMDEAERARRNLAKDIWRAIEEEQFFLHFQVQRAAVTNDVTGYEVLLRWRHPQRGMVPPDVFIPVAEQCGAITALGEWVLRRACEEASQWLPHEKIAVNLSPLQLSNVQLVDKVRQILLDTGLLPDRLELEVTESAIIGDKTRALHILRQIKAMGVTIAIDDFGTGYSSLETLRAFPFDKIKLDRSFVSDLSSDRQAKAFVRAILALGKSLEVPVLAEGVETIHQMTFLTEEGCDQFQGYYLGRPDHLHIVTMSKEKLATA